MDKLTEKLRHLDGFVLYFALMWGGGGPLGLILTMYSSVAPNFSLGLFGLICLICNFLILLDKPFHFRGSFGIGPYRRLGYVPLVLFSIVFSPLILIALITYIFVIEEAIRVRNLKTHILMFLFNPIYFILLNAALLFFGDNTKRRHPLVKIVSSAT